MLEHRGIVHLEAGDEKPQTRTDMKGWLAQLGL